MSYIIADRGEENENGEGTAYVESFTYDKTEQVYTDFEWTDLMWAAHRFTLEEAQKVKAFLDTDEYEGPVEIVEMPDLAGSRSERSGQIS